MVACPSSPRWRRLFAAGLCAGGAFVGGCVPANYVLDYPPKPPPVVIASPETAANPPLTLVDHHEPQPAQVAQPREVPITLDTVLRLAEQLNPRIGAAREKLHESQLTSAQGALGWLPNIYAGLAYYRHEGGIQQFDGRLTRSSTGALYPGLQIQADIDFREGVFQLIDLERRIWQQKAELTQVNNETLLEAAVTYIDLLTARRGEAVALDLEKFEQKLLERVEKLAKDEPAARAVVEGVKAALSNRQQLVSGLRQKGNAASAKLVYLLGLPPGTCLVPVDPLLSPVELVDTSPAACDLVAVALSNGPGVRELEGILAVAEMALEKTHGIHNLLPTVQFNLFEGPFGAGPGTSLAWANRLDAGLQVKWNLTQLCQTEFKRTLIRSRQAQVVLNYEDLKGKLAAGVTESRDAILFGREQIGLAAGQIRHASEGYRLSDRRLSEGLQGASPNEVLLAIRGLEQAHYNHLQAIQGHNKAQVRLMMLLGCGNAPPAPKPAAEAPQLSPAPQPAEIKADAARPPVKATMLFEPWQSRGAAK